MNIGILGSGMVGKTLAEGFLKLGHAVMIGSRKPELLDDFVKKNGKNISAADFEKVARFGKLIVFAVKGTEFENAILNAGKEQFDDKIIIDVTNPLIFEEAGKPPKLAASYPDSNGVKIQQLLPTAHVVKAFNSVPATYMCNPHLQEGNPDLFICGDAEGKKKVVEIARLFGWKKIVDVGAIEESYLLEALAMIWIKYGFDNNYWQHTFMLLKK
ncbi:MAG: hypothetical protein RL557_805 [archaeon]|jgi:predicted dinucleotide-binding enzyme